MSTDLHDEIRDYASWLDASAPTTEQLAQSTARKPVPVATRQVPAWTRGVLALAAVLLIGIPLAILFDGFGQEVEPADTITPFPVDGPVVLIADNGTMVLGKDHPPGSSVEVELNAARFDDIVLPPTQVAPDGRFEVVLWPEYALGDGEVAIVRVRSPGQSVDDPTTYEVIQLGIAFDLLDPVSDIAVGRASVPDGTPIQVRIESGTELTVVETETFNGAWEVDLSGTVDVTLESVGTAWAASGDGFAATAPRPAVGEGAQLDLIMGNWYLEGRNFAPGAVAEIRVNGEPLTAPATVGAGGRFGVFLESIGLEPGDVLAIDDGTTTKTLTVHELVVTDLDQEVGVISGITDLPDGTTVVVGHERSAGVEVLVSGGRFSASFAPGSIGYPDAGYMDDDDDWLGGTVDPSLEASAGGGPSDDPVEPTLGGDVVVLFDGQLEISGFGLAPGAQVDLELVEGDTTFSEAGVTTVATDGSFAQRFEGLLLPAGEARVTVGETTYVVPVVQVNLVRIFYESDQVGVEVQAPAGVNGLVRVTNGGQPTNIPILTTGQTLLVDVPGLERSSTVEFWIESGDGWVMNRGQVGSPQIEYFDGENLVYGSWFEPRETLTVSAGAETLGSVTTDELGRAEVFVALDPGSTITLANERVTVDLGPIPSLTIDGISGTTVFGTADVADGTPVTVLIEDGVNQENGDTSVFGGEWAFDTALEGPSRRIVVRWNDDEADQLVIVWIEP